MFQYRLIEAKYKFIAYKRLNVSLLSYVFLLKPIIGGLLPQKLLFYYHRKNFVEK